MTTHYVPASSALPVFASGDTVLLERGGEWPGLTIDVSGVTVGAYGDGPLPLLRPTIHAMEIRGNDNVIRDIETIGGLSAARLWGERNHVTRCYFHDIAPDDPDKTGCAVWILAPDNEVSYCRIERCTHPNPKWTCDGGAFSWFWYGDRAHVHHNLVVGNCGVLEVGTYEGQGSAHDCVVEYNVCINNNNFSWFHTTSQFAIDIRNFQIRYNVIVETGDVWFDFGLNGADVILHDNFIYMPAIGRIEMPGGDMALVDRITVIEDILMQLSAQVAQLRDEAQATDDVLDSLRDQAIAAADAIDADGEGSVG